MSNRFASIGQATTGLPALGGVTVSRVAAAHAVEGATYQQIQGAHTVQTAKGTAMSTQLSEIEDVDVAETAIEVTSANTAYQAALQTTATVRQLSLLEFLR
jgi:flagellar hook-associated protein 3 FlgL